MAGLMVPTESGAPSQISATKPTAAGRRNECAPGPLMLRAVIHQSLGQTHSLTHSLDSGSRARLCYALDIFGLWVLLVWKTGATVEMSAIFGKHSNANAASASISIPLQKMCRSKGIGYSKFTTPLQKQLNNPSTVETRWQTLGNYLESNYVESTLPTDAHGACSAVRNSNLETKMCLISCCILSFGLFMLRVLQVQIYRRVFSTWFDSSYCG